MTGTRALCAVGIDVGGTKIAGGLVDADGRVWARRMVPTEAHRGGAAVLAATRRLAEELRAEAEARPVVGIGVAVCELVDPAGNVTSSHTVAWDGMPIQAELSRLAPTVVESDARAPALAEARFGAGRDFTSFAYVTIGTGISCCLVIDGVPWAGERGNALVLATMPLTVAGSDGALVEFTLEEYASGPALARRYAEATGRSPPRPRATLLQRKSCAAAVSRWAAPWRGWSTSPIRRP
jgi:glucokinase